VLRNLSVTFGSLVDKGANPGAHILLFKRDDTAGAEAHEDVTAALATLGKVGRKMSGPRMAALKVAIEHLNQILSEVAASGCADDETKEPDMSQKKNDTPAVEQTDPAAEAPAVEKAEPIAEDAVTKRLADLEKRAADAEKRAADAENVAKAERDARLTNEFIAKASKYDALSQKPAELGPVLKRLHEAISAEDYAELDRVLTAANEAVGKSALFGEIGKAGDEAGNSATERINKMALELVEKGTHKNYADAFASVSKENPQLAGAYLAEQRARN
jgi:hypothetical protein